MAWTRAIGNQMTKMKTDFEKFAEQIGVEFDDIALLRAACTHRSYLNENKKSGTEHNERLEFLGDAVLELVVTSFLFRKYPKKAEGELTAFRSALVNTVSLTKVAQSIGLNDFMLLSRGEAKDGGRARSVILANAVEAVIGAIYMDRGYNAAANFISNHLLNTIDIEEIVKNKSWIDAKSRFQERAQEKTGITPSYRTLKEEGPDHDKKFTLGVFLGDVQVATGAGPSKQEAEQKAAEKALDIKGW
ncbi:ribonuclease III [Patescibacteria group bacterium]|nr:ribonuclease III [Patescibacteria group bacterium]MDE1946569.1 ribonuclease III [Patescibacteria group bacterium]MDE2010870.1 ribonuclease III [Patescibacteria group bacterium]MDE2232754.1 ribonuclease III [Patescibacteria group bacterium]